MSAASVTFIALAGCARPDDPVERANFETSVADLRAAVCTSAGVDPADISSLGYDHSDSAYQSVRAGWVSHVAMFGITWFRTDVEEAHALWTEARPDLAAGDDWRAAGEAAHRERYPDGCLDCTRSADWCPSRSCEVCDPIPAEEP